MFGSGFDDRYCAEREGMNGLVGSSQAGKPTHSIPEVQQCSPHRRDRDKLGLNLSLSHGVSSVRPCHSSPRQLQDLI